MIRFALRQFRTQAAVACGALAVIAVVLAISGPHLVHIYDTAVATCRTEGDCASATPAFLVRDRFVQIASATLLLVVPALIGSFWGAPLIAREFEAGTFRLAWTQSVTRGWWLAVKLGLVGLASMALAGLLSLGVTWWTSPFDRINLNWFSPGTFDERGLVPVGYAAFAFVLGVLAGLVIRRTIPAMATTLVVYIAARFAESLWVRPHLWTPLRIVSAFQVPTGSSGAAPSIGAGALTNAWVLSDQVINGAGHVIGENGGIGANGEVDLNVSPNGTLTFGGIGKCPNTVPPGTVSASNGFGGQSTHAARQTIQAAFQTCVDKLHIREVVTYQPANRFWLFQWEETAFFLAVALLLAGFCFWWVRRQYGGRAARSREVNAHASHAAKSKIRGAEPEPDSADQQLSVRAFRADTCAEGPRAPLRLVLDP